MKFNENDVKYLLSIGYANRDITQIKSVKRTVKLTDENGKNISQDKAVELIGREQFLSGLGRAAFHCSACREIDNHLIYFDAYHYFKY